MPTEVAQATTLTVQGVEIPKLGFGTGRSPARTARWRCDALELGYRHIDTARAYGNEANVGQGLHDSGLNRPTRCS